MSSVKWKDSDHGNGYQDSECEFGHTVVVWKASSRAQWRMETNTIPPRILKANTLPDAKREALELVAQFFDELAERARQAIEETGT